MSYICQPVFKNEVKMHGEKSGWRRRQGFRLR